MGRYGYRRARPKVSFALATGMLAVIGAVLSGLLRVEVAWDALDRQPQAVLVALVLVSVGGLLLYEW